jgi:hypothetical protein
MPFARGEAGINIAAADKLAVYFGLALGPRTPPTQLPKRK